MPGDVSSTPFFNSDFGMKAEASLVVPVECCDRAVGGGWSVRPLDARSSGELLGCALVLAGASVVLDSYKLS